jgi:hypothetical protein
MTDVIDSTLEVAAASPDPNVRAAAIKYRKLQHELSELEGFFVFYGRNRSEPIADAPKMSSLSATPRERAPRERPATSRAGTMATGKRGQVDAFVNRVCDMLKTGGAPLPLTTLYEQFFQQNPDEDRATCSQDTFRQRLTKKPHLIRTHEHKYWPTVMPWPGEDGQSLAA